MDKTGESPQKIRDPIMRIVAWIREQTEEAKGHSADCECTGCTLRWWEEPEDGQQQSGA